MSDRNRDEEVDANLLGQKRPLPPASGPGETPTLSAEEFDLMLNAIVQCDAGEMSDTDIEARDQLLAHDTALRRALAVAEAERDRHAEISDRRHDAIMQAHRQRDDIAAERDDIDKACTEQRSRANATHQKLKAALAERDALRTALERIIAYDDAVDNGISVDAPSWDDAMRCGKDALAALAAASVTERT